MAPALAKAYTSMPMRKVLMMVPNTAYSVMELKLRKNRFCNQVGCGVSRMLEYKTANSTQK